MTSYWESQLSRVTPDDTGIIRVKFFGETDSKFLSLTVEQFEAIKATMLTVERED